MEVKVLGLAPERADCGGRIKNPYYDAWKKVEMKALRLNSSYRESSDALFDLSASEDEYELCLDDLKSINEWIVPYTQKYAWAIPSEEALLEIARYSPLVEIGAGTGYWAWLLRQMGVDILAYDCKPPHLEKTENEFHREVDSWTEVLVGDESVLDALPDRTLFLCWPPSNHPMAFQTLSRFRGDRFLFVGEGWPSHATGDEAFFDLLESDWVMEEDHSRVWLPHWPGRDDLLWIFHRKREEEI